MGQMQLSKNFNIDSLIKDREIKIFSDTKIIKTKNLSSAFGCICEKVELLNGKKYVIKYQDKINNNKYRSVYYEGKSLLDMNKKFKNLFPIVHYLEKDMFIMDWIENNGKKNKFSEKDLAKKLSSIHSVKNDMFGYNYNTPIGGLEQPSQYNNNWIDFYRNSRLLMIFEIINNKEPMPSKVNKGIEKILNNLESLLPKTDVASLIHGDLWTGNILYNNGNLAGLIDPAIHFAHIELELSSLTFLNVVSKKFFDEYREFIHLDFNYEERIGVYELYYALLNVYLWDRSYINQTYDIIKKYT